MKNVDGLRRGQHKEVVNKQQNSSEPAPVQQNVSSATTTPISNRNRGGSWATMENGVSTIGKWAWIIPLIAGIIYLIALIPVILLYGYWVGSPVFQYTASEVWAGFWGPFIWVLLVVIIEIAFAVLWVKPRFSNHCAKKEWQLLVDSSLHLGSIRIPWMLILGIVVEIFGYGWGGLAIIVPALLIIFFAPVNFRLESD